MSNQELHKDQTERILRYLSGNAADAEVQQLEDWVLAAPENKRQFRTVKKAWILSGMQEDDQEADVNQWWAQTSRQLFETPKVVDLPRRPTRNRWLRLAAAIALLAAASIWALLSLGGEKAMTVATTDKVRSFELPDGSLVTLNQFSELSYVPIQADETTGTAAQRRIELAGDALFDVAREPDRPFIINSGALEVEVLGTSFYVDARETQAEIQVIVASGMVAVRTDSAAPVTLTSNQKAVYQKESGQLNRLTNDDPNFGSIKTDTLIFDNSSLEEVAFALSRHYNVNISYDGIEDPSNCELSGTFPNYTLEDIIAIIKAAWSIEVLQTEGQLFFSGTGCNDQSG